MQLCAQHFTFGEHALFRLPNIVKIKKMTLLSKGNNQLNKSVVIRMQAVVHPVFLTPPVYQQSNPNCMEEGRMLLVFKAALMLLGSHQNTGGRSSVPITNSRTERGKREGKERERESERAREAGLLLILLPAGDCRILLVQLFMLPEYQVALLCQAIPTSSPFCSGYGS